MVNALFGAAQTGFGRLWRAKRWLAPSRPWLHEHFGRAAVKGGVFALFGAARTGPRRLWRALRRLAPSRPWLHEHFGRAAVTGAVFALFGAARTGPRRLRRALRRLAPSRPWFHRHLGWLTVSVGVIVLFGAAQTELGQRALGGAGVARAATRPTWSSTSATRPSSLPRSTETRTRCFGSWCGPRRCIADRLGGTPTSHRPPVEEKWGTDASRSLPARPRPSSLACMSAVTVTPACNCWSPSRTAVSASTNG